jgi:hypothetical protein
MRAVRNVRYLSQGEIDIAMKVFRLSLPYNKIVISDGLGYDDRPFTVPTNVPMSAIFNVKEGKYVIHAGDGYYGMSKLQKDKELLIHELVHVWQGEHSSKAWHVMAKSAWHQALSDDAYAYDPNHYLDWNEYNPEQQASIVEHWFAGEMKKTKEEDLRFYYIKKYIWGEKMDSDWIADSRAIKPLERATLEVHAQPQSIDGALLPLIQKRFDANDVRGYSNREKQLEGLFAGTGGEAARSLIPRLEKRKAGDKLSEYFHDNLSTPLRQKLVSILRQRVSPSRQDG